MLAHRSTKSRAALDAHGALQPDDTAAVGTGCPLVGIAAFTRSVHRGDAIVVGDAMDSGAVGVGRAGRACLIVQKRRGTGGRIAVDLVAGDARRAGTGGVRPAQGDAARYGCRDEVGGGVGCRRDKWRVGDDDDALATGATASERVSCTTTPSPIASIGGATETSAAGATAPAAAPAARWSSRCTIRSLRPDGVLRSGAATASGTSCGERATRITAAAAAAVRAIAAVGRAR